MKVKYEIVDQRRRELLEIIRQAKTISTNQLLEQSDMSSVTIRRDLVYLEEQHCISRYHGGCTYLGQLENHSGIKSLPAKYLIARKAAELIEDGDIIFINSSSTALLTLQYITDKRVTVITNNAKALSIDHDPLVSLYFTGGEIRFPKEVMVGDLALSTLGKIIANKAIMGCSGLDISTGITTANSSEVSVNQEMIRQTHGQVIMLAEPDKLGIKHSFCSGSVSDIDILITSSQADESLCDSIASQGVKIIRINN